MSEWTQQLCGSVFWFPKTGFAVDGETEQFRDFADKSFFVSYYCAHTPQSKGCVLSSEKTTLGSMWLSSQR
jgi:hypothetical protein